MKIKKYFGGIRMTWTRVILFAVITAVYTAAVNEIPFLSNTSFRDIAVTFEWWILFAIFIIVNCDKWWEASLKCFVFFLISQPLIFLIEVPFEPIGWGLFTNYYGYWFFVTVLTLPGAAIAFLVKKQNWLSVAVLSVATGFLAWMGVDYFKSALSDFPHHLLTALFCFAQAIFLIFVLFDKKKLRIAALSIFLAILLTLSVFAGIDIADNSETVFLGEGNWSYTIEDAAVAEVELTGDGQAVITARKNGNTLLVFEAEDGSKKEYSVTVSDFDVIVSDFD